MSVESVIAIVGDCYLVREVSPTGQLITRWERCENLMSKISSTTLDTEVYLYSSKEDAENCIDAGGSGFLVGISDGVKPGGWVYAVTNQHVIEEGYKTVRLNRIDGSKAILQPKVWTCHPDRKTDLSIASLGVENLRIFSFHTFMPNLHFIDKTRLIDYEVGVGDDCYMIGRFINHEGYQRNLPTVRFGAIAQMPGEPIPTQWKVQEEAYLVEMRSISGFSGSPVIVRIPAGRALKVGASKPVHVTYDPTNDWHMLLGIDCGHSNDKDTALYYPADADKPLEEFKIEYNTGLAIVIPAWKLQEIIDSPEATKMRDEEKREYQKRARGTRLDTREPSQQLTHPKEGEPMKIPIPTRGHFERDLAKAIRNRDKTSK